MEAPLLSAFSLQGEEANLPHGWRYYKYIDKKQIIEPAVDRDVSENWIIILTITTIITNYILRNKQLVRYEI